ncbi:hypothetical protein ES706_03589 [subsurface metagenome]
MGKVSVIANEVKSRFIQPLLSGAGFIGNICSHGFNRAKKGGENNEDSRYSFAFGTL